MQVVHMVREYDLDALRLDTAPYMPMGFLAELQVVLPLPSCAIPLLARASPPPVPPRACAAWLPQVVSPLRPSASHPSVPVPLRLPSSASTPPLPLPPARACAGRLGADVTLLSY